MAPLICEIPNYQIIIVEEPTLWRFSRPCEWWTPFLIISPGYKPTPNEIGTARTHDARYTTHYTPQKLMLGQRAGAKAFYSTGQATERSYLVRTYSYCVFPSAVPGYTAQQSPIGSTGVLRHRYTWKTKHRVVAIHVIWHSSVFSARNGCYEQRPALK